MLYRLTSRPWLRSLERKKKNILFGWIGSDYFLSDQTMDDINQSLGAIYKWQTNINNNKKKKKNKIYDLGRVLDVEQEQKRSEQCQQRQHPPLQHIIHFSLSHTYRGQTQSHKNYCICLTKPLRDLVRYFAHHLNREIVFWKHCLVLSRTNSTPHA